MKNVFILVSILLLIENCKPVGGVSRQSSFGQCAEWNGMKKTRSVKQAQNNKIKIIKKTNFVERLNKRKSGKTSKKSYRNYVCNTCSTCNFDFMVDMAKLNNKYAKKLKDLKNILKWWILLKGKHGKAVLDPSLSPPAPAFSIAFNLLSNATEGGTTCNGEKIGTEALDIYKQLENCTASAIFACDYNTITNNFKKLLCNKNCSSSCCISSPNCTKKAVCTSTCGDDPSPEYGNVVLNQTMMNHVENICIPQLTDWTRRYASCGACITFKDCVYTCQDGKLQYNCQAKKCETCLEGKNRKEGCTFEDCLQKGANNGDDARMRECMCNCYRDLNNTKTGNFPINMTRVDGKNCIELAQFFFAVRMRKRRCLTADGITRTEEVIGNEEATRGDGYKPLDSAKDDRLAGNFVDCRRQERNAMEYIYACKFNGTPSTATSTSGRRNQFFEAMRMLQLAKRNVKKKKHHF